MNSVAERHRPFMGGHHISTNELQSSIQYIVQFSIFHIFLHFGTPLAVEGFHCNAY
jgi:hypothetical protein